MKKFKMPFVKRTVFEVVKAENEELSKHNDEVLNQMVKKWNELQEVKEENINLRGDIDRLNNELEECEKQKELIKDRSFRVLKNKRKIELEKTEAYTKLAATTVKLANANNKINEYKEGGIDEYKEVNKHLLRELERANEMSRQLVEKLNTDVENPWVLIEHLRALARLTAPRKETVNEIEKEGR